MRAALTHALLLGWAVLAALGTAELALRLATPPTAFRHGWSQDFWWAYNRTRDCPPVAGDLQADPSLGWRMRRDYRGPGVVHDARGFRRTVGTSAAAGSRVLLLGNSYTYGLGVEDGETYASQLSRLTGAEVHDAGVNGYGIDQALLLWEEEGVALRPEVVVLGYYTDDFHRNALALRQAPKPRFIPVARGGYRLEPPVSCARLIAHGSAWRLPALLRAAWRRLLDRIGRLPVEMLRARRRLSRALLERLDVSVRAHGARLVVLLIPHCEHPEDGKYGGWIMPRVRRDCRDLGLQYLDFTGDLSPALFGANCHWSARGHRMVAERLADALHLGEREADRTGAGDRRRTPEPVYSSRGKLR